MMNIFTHSSLINSIKTIATPMQLKYGCRFKTMCNKLFLPSMNKNIPIYSKIMSKLSLLLSPPSSTLRALPFMTIKRNFNAIHRNCNAINRSFSSSSSRYMNSSTNQCFSSSKRYFSSRQPWKVQNSRNPWLDKIKYSQYLQGPNLIYGLIGKNDLWIYVQHVRTCTYILCVCTCICLYSYFYM